MASKLNINCARLASTFVAGLFTSVLETVQQTTTRRITTKLSPLSNLARHSLRRLAAMTLNCYTHSARRAATRVAQDLAGIMGAVRILLSIAVFTTRVRQSQ